MPKMDHIDVTPDSSPPVYLSIPSDAESALPARSVSVNELLQYEFPNPFWTPYAGGHVPTWSSSPPHHVHTAVLLSHGIPQRKVAQELLLDLQRLPSAPQSINRAALLLCEALPSLLPIWVLSFWDCLSEAYITSMSWRRSLHLSLPIHQNTMGHPEDQEHADEASVDSSLSIDKMASWIADGVPEPLVDLSGDENEGVDGFGREDNQHPVQI